MTWVLLWSQRQNALHIEPMDAMLSANRNAYRDNRPGDYRLLFVGDKETVDAAADAMRSTMADREVGRELPLLQAPLKTGEQAPHGSRAPARLGQGEQA